MLLGQKKITYFLCYHITSNWQIFFGMKLQKYQLQ